MGVKINCLAEISKSFTLKVAEISKCFSLKVVVSSKSTTHLTSDVNLSCYALLFDT